MDTVLKDLQTIDDTIRVNDAEDRGRWRGVWQAALALNGPYAEEEQDEEH